MAAAAKWNEESRPTNHNTALCVWCHGPIISQQVAGRRAYAFTRAHTMYLKTRLTLFGVRYAMVVIITRPGTYATYVRCGG